LYPQRRRTWSAWQQQRPSRRSLMSCIFSILNRFSNVSQYWQHPWRQQQSMRQQQRTGWRKQMQEPPIPGNKNMTMVPMVYWCLLSICLGHPEKMPIDLLTPTRVAFVSHRVTPTSHVLKHSLLARGQP
jgi:hypothetical protein